MGKLPLHIKISIYRSFVINIGLKQAHIHIDRRIIRPMLVQFVT